MTQSTNGWYLTRPAQIARARKAAARLRAEALEHDRRANEWQAAYDRWRSEGAAASTHMELEGQLSLDDCLPHGIERPEEAR